MKEQQNGRALVVGALYGGIYGAVLGFVLGALAGARDPVGANETLLTYCAGAALFGALAAVVVGTASDAWPEPGQDAEALAAKHGVATTHSLPVTGVPGLPGSAGGGFEGGGSGGGGASGSW